ncbi:MAG: hypothetical protein HYR97_01000 [Candidatus Melainabacteria bacterium]|nr:hypothetical protein [Candidatus Melainabacteria bacterium]
MRAETINLSWWNRPIGYNTSCGKSIPKWRKDSSPSIIKIMTPTAIASASLGILGAILSLFGFTSDKKSLGLLGVLGCLAGTFGFIYNSTTATDVSETEPIQSPSTDKDPHEHQSPPSEKRVLKESNVPVANNPFFKKEGICTSDPDVLIVDIYHGILSGDVKKVQDVIDRLKKLELEKVKPLINNKLQEVKVVAVLSLISRDDYESNPEVKQMLLDLAKQDATVLRTIRNLTQTEKDNKVIFDRLILLLSLLGN